MSRVQGVGNSMFGCLIAFDQIPGEFCKWGADFFSGPDLSLGRDRIKALTVAVRELKFFGSAVSEIWLCAASATLCHFCYPTARLKHWVMKLSWLCLR